MLKGLLQARYSQIIDGSELVKSRGTVNNMLLSFIAVLLDASSLWS